MILRRIGAINTLTDKDKWCIVNLIMLKELVINHNEVTLPKHQLVRYIRNQIKSGRLKPGERLPTVRKIVQHAGISTKTANMAFSLLREEGLVEASQRGTFVKADLLAENQEGSREKLAAYGLILPEIHGDLYPALIRGVDRQAAAEHYQVIVGCTNNDVGQQADVIMQMIDKNVAGVAMVPTIPLPPLYQIRLLKRNKIPLVFCHRKVAEANAPFIGWDSVEIGRLAGQNFLERGHKSIAFFGASREKNLISEDFEKGLRRAMEQKGLILEQENIFYKTLDLKAGFVESDLIPLAKSLESSHRPTAIFCESDISAEHIYFMSQKLNLKVPEDISIISFGNTRCEGVLGKRLSYISPDEQELGVQAAKVLHEMYLGKRPLHDNQEILLPLTLSSGKTLGPVFTK